MLLWHWVSPFVTALLLRAFSVTGENGDDHDHEVGCKTALQLGGVEIPHY